MEHSRVPAFLSAVCMEVDSRHYTVDSEGHTFGPVTIETIRRWGEEGRLDETTTIRSTKDGEVISGQDWPKIVGIAQGSDPPRIQKRLETRTVSKTIQLKISPLLFDRILAVSLLFIGFMYLLSIFWGAGWVGRSTVGGALAGFTSYLVLQGKKFGFYLATIFLLLQSVMIAQTVDSVGVIASLDPSLRNVSWQTDFAWVILAPLIAMCAYSTLRASNKTLALSLESVEPTTDEI